MLGWTTKSRSMRGTATEANRLGRAARVRRRALLSGMEGIVGTATLPRPFDLNTLILNDHRAADMQCTSKERP